MYVPNLPTVRPQHLRLNPPSLPGWLSDETWIPAGDQRVYAFARTGLLALLHQLESGTALIPEYLPPGVVRCFVDAGFDIEYYGVEPDLTLPSSTIEAKLRSVRPTVVLFVHYFGFADEAFPRLAETAQSEGSFVIEDIARGLFGRDRGGRLLGSTGDAAIFSLRKVLPNPHGGLVVSSGDELPPPGEPLRERRELVHSMGVAGARLIGWAPFKDTYAEFDRLRFYDYAGADVDHPHGLWPPRSVGHLSRIGLNRTDPSDVRRARQSRYELAYEGLSGTPGLTVLSPPPAEWACPYGVVVSTQREQQVATRILRRLRRRGLPAETFRWPTGIDRQELDDFPGAIPLRFSTFVLPTHPQVSHQVVERAVETIQEGV